ncbi:DUF1564 domain-containing protein, partial [Leptospira interrogans]
MLGFYSDFLQKFFLQIVPFGKFEKPFSNMDILLLDDGQKIES